MCDPIEATMSLQPVKFTPQQLNPNIMPRHIYQINVSSKQEQSIVLDVCEKLGYKKVQLYDTEEEPYNIILQDNNTITGDIKKDFILSNGGKIITIDELIKLKIFKLKKVKLNDKYTATVYKETVVVGCQTFTHSAIEALYKAIKEA